MVFLKMANVPDSVQMRPTFFHALDEWKTTLSKGSHPWYEAPAGHMSKPDFKREQQGRLFVESKTPIPANTGWFAKSAYSKRWFVLKKTQKQLRYYMSPSTLTDEKGFIDLTQIIGMDYSLVGDAPPYSFDLISNDRHFTLSCDSHTEMLKWGLALRECIPELTEAAAAAVKLATEKLKAKAQIRRMSANFSDSLMKETQDWATFVPDTSVMAVPTFDSISAFFKHKGTKFLILWLLWLLTGSLFYAYKMDLGWSKGFYMAVNVGYSIGWGDIPEPGLTSKGFSTFFVLCGSSFVGAALGFFAQSAVSDADNWYVNQCQAKKFEVDYENASNWITKCFYFIDYHWIPFRVILAWIVFIMTATVFALLTQPDDWAFGTALYFAVSSVSTGGLQSLDATVTTDWMYGFTGVYAALGVPLMGIAMAIIGGCFIEGTTIEETMEKVEEAVTLDEVNMLENLGLIDGDGIIDKTEFIILCMVRIGAADPELIGLITEYFNLLDEDGSGNLTLDEVTQTRTSIKEKKSQRTKRPSISDIRAGVGIEMPSTAKALAGFAKLATGDLTEMPLPIPPKIHNVPEVSPGVGFSLVPSGYNAV